MLSKLFKQKSTAILILTLITFLVYSFSLGNQFLWDDETQIVGNTIIHNLKNFPTLFTGGIVYTPGQNLSGGFYRPVLTFSYMILYAVSSTPLIFRLFQVTTHVVNTIFIYLIFNVLLLKKFNENNAKRTAFFAALVFGIHPAISEGVLFIAGLGEPLFTLFCLLSFWYFLKQYSTVNNLLSSGFLFLALLTKETAVILPVIMFFYLILFTPLKKSYRRLIIPTAVLIGYFLLRLIFLKDFLSNLQFPAPIAQTSLLTRLLIIPFEICYYLLLIIFPYYLSISQHQIITSLIDIRFWGSLIIILILTSGIFLFYRRTKTRLLLFFLIWFILGLLPVLNIIPLSATIAERWLYFPFIGLAGAVAIVLNTLRQTIKLKANWLMVICGFFLLILAIRTVIRTSNWQNGLKLFSHDIKINPASFELQNNYGVELFRTGEVGLAEEYFKKSIELNPKWWTHYNNLGVVWQRRGNLDKAKEYYQKAISEGNYYLAYQNLAETYVQNKEYEKANQFLKETILYFPVNARLHKLYAISLYQSGQSQEALKTIKTALSLEPSQQNYFLFQKITNKEKLD